MAGRSRTRAADRSEAESYRRVGDALLESAIALSDLADEGGRYGNAIAIIAIHAAIAWTDTLTIAYGARKSTDGDHSRAADLLFEVLGSSRDENKIKVLRGVLSTKDRVSYTGSYYTARDAAQLLKRSAEFISWARGLYEKRPPVRR
ncbi:MAG: hypothetical protein ACT4O1_16500 [Gemmatimonadota bacterium]